MASEVNGRADFYAHQSGKELKHKVRTHNPPIQPPAPRPRSRSPRLGPAASKSASGRHYRVGAI